MTLVRRSRPTVITDAPEHRAIPLDRVELRDDSDDNEIVLEGYASTFEEYEMYGGPANYGWIERIDPGAFEVTLREKPDLHLLINHAGMPLARTKSGTLDLSVDEQGLKVVARLDKRDPEVQALAVKMERGDMDEMSFAFRVKKQEWKAADGFEETDDQSYRTITEVSLHKGDVSVVNWGANPTTSAGVRSALRALAEADEDELAEIRSDGVLMSAVRELFVGPGEVRIENVNVSNVEGLTGTFLDGVLTPNEIREIEGMEPIETRDEEEVEDDEVEEEVEETEDAPLVVAESDTEETLSDIPAADETEIETIETEEREDKGMSLRSALALQGVLSDGEGGSLSLEAALALA